MNTKKITPQQTYLIKRVLTGILALALIGLAFLGLFKTTPPALSQLSLKQLELTKETALADGEDAVKATITLSLPPDYSKSNLYLGLQVIPSSLITPEFTQKGFYKGDRKEAFVLVEDGQAVFYLKSLKAGRITYQPYIAQLSSQNKLQFKKLSKGFQIEFAEF